MDRESPSWPCLAANWHVEGVKMKPQQHNGEENLPRLNRRRGDGMKLEATEAVNGRDAAL